MVRQPYLQQPWSSTHGALRSQFLQGLAARINLSHPNWLQDSRKRYLLCSQLSHLKAKKAAHQSSTVWYRSKLSATRPPLNFQKACEKKRRWKQLLQEKAVQTQVLFSLARQREQEAKLMAARPLWRENAFTSKQSRKKTATPSWWINIKFKLPCFKRNSVEVRRRRRTKDKIYHQRAQQPSLTKLPCQSPCISEMWNIMTRLAKKTIRSFPTSRLQVASKS